ncbi:phospholipase B-like protein [Acrasis kona]|uniref:Phospholipase B-like n=1 Tax=Acrasis kona TaxID=1008807 RepID=A0AAW2ZK35_9EUKA
MKYALIGSLLFLIAICSQVSCQNRIDATVYQVGSTYTVSIGKKNIQDGVAVASFLDTTMKNGWAQINITSSNKFNSSAQAYSAGFIEGFLTQKNIWNFYPNQFQVWGFNKTIPDKMLKFMSENLEWTRLQASKSQNDAYWEHVSLVLKQFDGLVAGYQRSAPKEEQLSEIELYFLNAAGDLEDLIPAIMDAPHFSKNKRLNSKMPRGDNKIGDDDGDDLSDCSALISLQDDDIFAGHTTWRSFGIINKFYKSVSLFINNEEKAVSYASSPGFLSSKDDFYVTSNQLLVMETTNSVFNTKLYNSVSPKSVLCWVRSIVCNMMCTTGSCWTETFARYNSGSYNNQWMVVDYKIPFSAPRVVSPNTLWILEQIPGYTERRDVSDVLNKQKFWSSYNIPYFEAVYNKSGFPERKVEWGDNYDYYNCPRANIFRRQQSEIKTLEDIGSVLQHNEWQSDPFSKGDPANAISARYDLRRDLSKAHPFGGIDSKIADKKYVQMLVADGICGPTHQNQVPFKWEPKHANISHGGQPQEFNFGFIQLNRF